MSRLTEWVEWLDIALVSSKRLKKTKVSLAMARSKVTVADPLAPWTPRKWIVPPGLKAYLNKFELRCDSLINRRKNDQTLPLLIKGPTGVGKSLFTEFFIHKFFNAFGPLPVKIINCAAIPEKLLETELFGYAKGSHSTADSDKGGILEYVQNGVLVLEEIGEMSKALQAKILTVIELKKFTKIGGLKDIFFDGQVIATTNVANSEIRDDLRYRFDIFSVPPIHMRRKDVLYYIEHFDNDLINILTEDSVLSALSYNWPGNVREIARVCSELRENVMLAVNEGRLLAQEMRFVLPFDEGEQLSELMSCDNEMSGADFSKSHRVAAKMKAFGISTRNINKVLQKNNLSLGSQGRLYVGNKSKQARKFCKTEKRCIFGSIDIVKNNYFEMTHVGFEEFCQLFIQDQHFDDDLLNFKCALKVDGTLAGTRIANYKRKSVKQNEIVILKGKQYQEYPADAMFHCLLNRKIQKQPIFRFTIHLPEIFQKALLDSLRFLTGDIDLSLSDVVCLDKYHSKNPSNQFLSFIFGASKVSESYEEIHIENVSLNELRELYYETLCNSIGTAHGYKKNIARIAKRTPGRITQEFEELGLNKKFTKLNFMPRKRLLILK